METDSQVFSKVEVIQNYIPTEEDRENDRLAEEWKERRREESRLIFLRQQNRLSKYAM